LLVGMKSDLRGDNETLHYLEKKRMEPISQPQVVQLMKDESINSYVECSALTGEGLKNVFDEAIRVVLLEKEKKRIDVTKKCKCDIF